MNNVNLPYPHELGGESYGILVVGGDHHRDIAAASGSKFREKMKPGDNEFQQHYNFPGYSCVSLNDHWIIYVPYNNNNNINWIPSGQFISDSRETSLVLTTRRLRIHVSVEG